MNISVFPFQLYVNCILYPKSRYNSLYQFYFLFVCHKHSTAICRLKPLAILILEESLYQVSPVFPLEKKHHN